MVAVKTGRAVVVGAGPNGLTAAVTLARAGLQVECFEANSFIGGGASTREITQPGYLHDLGSSIHPMALASPVFQALRLTDVVQFAVPEVSFGHVLRDSSAVLCYRDVAQTAAELGQDGRAYRVLLAPLAERGEELAQTVLRHDPGGALTSLWPLTKFGLRTLHQGMSTFGWGFRGERAPALLSGVAAHTIGTHPHVVRAATGLMLSALAHSVGWPVPRGGSQSISDALAADLLAHGGTITTGVEVTSLEQVGRADMVLLDTTPTQLLRMAGARLPRRYARTLERFRYGPGASVAHFALEGPVPWADARCGSTPTLHLAGSRADMVAAGRSVVQGRPAEYPYILLTQPAAWDGTRAPEGHATVQAYCHVPHAYPHDLVDVIQQRIEQHAPGFTDRIVARASCPATELHRVSQNFVGGDFAAGAMTLDQLFTRPSVALAPWRTPLPGVYLCSSSTPPGPAVHGMAGYNAAAMALRDAGIMRHLRDSTRSGRGGCGVDCVGWQG